MNLARLASALVAGLLFGSGLVVSQMIDPAKVLNFLDIGAAPAGGWDPSLAFVMAAAIPVAMLGIRLGRRIGHPILATAFSTPATAPIDGRLIAGSMMFGAGWGLVGYCPGPALAALGGASSVTLIFVAAMAAGMGAFRLIHRPPSSAPRPAAKVSGPGNPSARHPPPAPAR